MATMARQRSGGIFRPRWLVLAFVVIMAVIVGTQYKQILLWNQDLGIRAPSPQGPLDPCFRGDPSVTYEDLIAQRQHGVNLVRIEPPYDVNTGAAPTLNDHLFMRYTEDGAVHVVYDGTGGADLKGFRVSAETFHRELGKMTNLNLLGRVRVFGSSLPPGVLQHFPDFSVAYAFMNWVGFGCGKPQ